MPLGTEKRDWLDWQCPPGAASESYKIGWIEEAVQSGQSWIRSQRGYRDFRRALDTFAGQESSPTATATYRSRLNTNRLKRNVREVVSVMSKLRPFWGYHSDNTAYKDQAEMMNKVTRAWYLEAMADRVIKEALQFAAATGRGWVCPVYRRDMYGTGRGDIKLLAYGAPSVLPVQLPSNNDWQSAYAINILDDVPVAMAHGMFPSFQHRLKPASSRYWYAAGTVPRGRSLGNVVSRMFGRAPRSEDTTGLADFLVPITKSYVLDLSINTTKAEIPMGEPGSSWFYTVPYVGQDIPVGADAEGRTVTRKATENDARLYPYRRLILSSHDCVMYDGPNFDWHGMFPGVSFCPDDWPWEPIGFSLVHDGYEINEAIKEIDRGNMDKVRAQLDPSLMFDKNVTSMREMRQFDPLQPRGRLAYDGTAGVGEGGPVQLAMPHELLKVEPDSLAFRQVLQDALDSQMALHDVMALAKARAAGSMDELEKIMELQGPIVEDMSRSMEPPMRDLGNMIKYLVLQYYTTPRVMQIVGPDGVTPEVFDYDPASIVPSHMMGEAPERASGYTKIQRARNFADNLRFFILPNSLHEMTQMTMKLGLVQLKKAQVKLSSQALAEAWNVPNYGTFEGNTEIERWKSEQELDLEFAGRMMAIKAAIAAELGAGQQGDLQAGGPGGSKQQEGRPPSGHASPKLVSKEGGARSTIAESR